MSPKHSLLVPNLLPAAGPEFTRRGRTLTKSKSMMSMARIVVEDPLLRVLRIAFDFDAVGEP